MKLIDVFLRELKGLGRFIKWVWKNLKTPAGRSRVWHVFLNILKSLPRIIKWRHIASVLVAVLIFLFIFGGFFVLWAASLKTPDLSSFDDRLVSQSTKIYDRTGNILLYDLSQNVRRTVVPFDQISPYEKEAAVAIEDAGFYQHNGIKISSIIRAFFADIWTLHFSQGGSTITQQVVKNSLLTGDKTISRKIKEWVLAIKLEQVADKNTILNLYLNNTPYGGNIYGIEEASQVFFGKHAADLDLAESAYLAALPQAPTYYSPFGNNKAALVDRKNLVLQKMRELNDITADEYNAAIQENVAFKTASVGGIKAPHFVMFIRDYLAKKYGEDALQQGGLSVITTLDYDLQQKAEQVVKDYILKNGKALNASNGALVAIDPTNGQILAMVGSRDYFDTTIDGNFNVATAHRQPGSSFKPFVYATAFDKGYTPDTAIFDVPTEFSTGCSVTGYPISPGAVCYSPQDYDNTYMGVMSLRTALALSRNVPAVKLLYLAGVQNSIETARKMGIQSLGDANQYGLTLVLGGGEVSPLDMTSAYGVFSQDGVRNPDTGILEVKDRAGNDLERFATSSSLVLNPQSARLVNDVLSDNNARAPVFGPVYFGGKRVAMKTGTTNNSRDAWVIGYTPSIAVGVWMGNNDNAPMVQKASAAIAAPMWKQFMDYALTKVPDTQFTPPDPTDPNLKPFLKGFWQGDGLSGIHSELYWINKNDPTGPAPTDPNSDPQFRLWEYGVQNWAASQNLLTTPTTVGNFTPGPVVVPGTTDIDGPVFTLSSPNQNNTIDGNTRVTITPNIQSSSTISRIDYFVNNTLIGSSTQAPFLFSFVPNDTENIQATNEVRALATDINGKRGEASFSFSVIK
ncbi:MAG: PBP1A family penicillin-binding protein [Candidatus Pacebacteria bacterium]|nr:PBP1A family penicillin-binding protein [Candidatus Paceibacterota bacterium]